MDGKGTAVHLSREGLGKNDTQLDRNPFHQNNLPVVVLAWVRWMLHFSLNKKVCHEGDMMASSP